MATLYHGITVRDAATACGVSTSTVRGWINRGFITRTTDGQINPFDLQDWWDYKRDHDQADRRAKRAS